MIRRGATIPTEQIEPLGAFLAQALPPRVRSRSAESSPIATALGEAAIRPIQTWVRGVGKLQNDRTTIIAMLSPQETAAVRAGQRVRAFAVTSRSSMYQGRVARVGAAQITVQLASRTPLTAETYLLEIITEGSPTLSIPNEAIIEEGNRRIVYVQQGADYVPREIQAGVQGELHTEITAGLKSGEQVVTFGSFFIDAEYKLKANAQSPPSGGVLTIDYRGTPNPPREGENAVEVLIRQADGTPLTDGTVTVTYSMAAMPSMNMPEMRDAFTLTHRQNGKYTGDVRLSMGGTWRVDVIVSRDGRPLDKKEFTVIAK